MQISYRRFVFSLDDDICTGLVWSEINLSRSERVSPTGAASGNLVVVLLSPIASIKCTLGSDTKLTGICCTLPQREKKRGERERGRERAKGERGRGGKEEREREKEKDRAKGEREGGTKRK